MEKSVACNDVYHLSLYCSTGIQAQKQTTSTGVQCDLTNELPIDIQPSRESDDDAAHFTDSESVHMCDDDPDYKPTSDDYAQERLDAQEDEYRLVRYGNF